jgi:pimeloyl-ACP methyl ester carboxylesterase
MTFILFKEKKIFYRISGQGNPVLLLHGFGEDGRIWRHQEEKLKENNLVIIPDIPGSGQSELIEEIESLEDYAEIIKAIADKEILNHHKNFTLIGHSMGGYITLAFAKKYPHLLNSFGLFHSSAFADTISKIETRKKSIDFIQSHGSAGFLKTSIPNLFYEENQQLHPEFIENLLSIASTISKDELIQYTKAMMERPDNRDVLRSFSKPILFIIGMHDTAVPLELSLQQCHLPINSTVHFLQNSGHMGMWEEQELSTKYLLQFLVEL